MLRPTVSSARRASVLALAALVLPLASCMAPIDESDPEGDEEEAAYDDEESTGEASSDIKYCPAYVCDPPVEPPTVYIPKADLVVEPVLPGYPCYVGSWWYGLRYNIVNRGEATAAPSKFHASIETQTSSWLYNIPSLPVGASYMVELPGQYQWDWMKMQVKADSTGLVQETNETNNKITFLCNWY